MAKKKLEIEVGVDQSQLDQVLQKTGELKKLSDNISIQYDIDGKPIDVVLNKSLNLQKQVRALTAELRKTKEGTAEFKLLSTALGDAQDGLARSNAKSRDLLASLQLLPGPVGEFASQLNGAIGLLKTFSSFSIKDIGFQLKETVNDIGDIITNFTNLSGPVKQVKEDNDELADSVERSSQSLNTSAGASIKAAKSFKDLSDEQKKAAGSSGMFDAATGKVTTAAENAAAAVNTENQALTQNTKVSTGAAVSNGILGRSLQAVGASALAASGAVAVLDAALAAIGIGLIIAAVVALGTALYKVTKSLLGFKEETEENITMTNAFVAALKREEEALALDLEAIELSTKALETRAKIAGKSEQEILEITRQAGKDKLQALRDYDEVLYKEQKEASKNSKLTAEQQEQLLKEINDKIIANGRAINKQIMLNEQETLDARLAAQNKFKELQKKNAEDYYNRRLKELDALIQLEINKDATSKEVLQKYLEERARLVIRHDKMTYAEAQLLRQQNDKKTKDALEEDIKRVEAYNSKRRDLEIAAIEDEEKRQVATRFKKLKDDETALKYDYEFQKKTKAEQDEILKNMEIAYQIDLLKIRDSFYMKRFQQEQEAGIKQKEQLTATRERELASNQMRIDNVKDFNTIYGDYIFGNKGLKGIWEKYFVDLRDVYNTDYANTQAQFEKEKEDLKGALSANLITRESYEQQIIAIDDKIYQNRVTNAQRQLDLDRLELDSKRANADMTIQIGERLTSALGAIAGKNRAIQKAAAIAEGITAIARIITDTTRAIASFSASVAPLGPAGIPIAAAYAVKAKISAALGIATIVGQSIGKLNSIDESGNTSASSGQQGNNLGRSYAQGGYIDGPRHAQGGVMINAEGGEAVMTRGAVTMFAPLLSAMNQMGGGTSFANMNVSRPDAPVVSNPASEQAPIIVKTYVVEKDMTTSQNKQARLKDLSTL